MSTTLTGEHRSALEGLVQRARRCAEDDLTTTLSGKFGIDADGRIEPIEQLSLTNAEAAVRRDLVQILEHLRSEGEGPEESVDRLVRETAFTHLNRLVAVRVAEAIHLLPETIGRGVASSGFRDFSEVAPTVAATEWGRFSIFVRLCGDELASDVPALFDPRNPLLELGLTEAALERLVIGITALGHDVWAAPDALGWVYQFFNTSVERAAIKKVGAPRNTRELAITNQFFTPSYVVDFLVQNGLGAHLARSIPGLEDELPLLIPGPGVSQEIELSAVSVLDPACGSGHFLLGAYDVLEKAWRRAGVEPSEAAPAIVSVLWGIDIDLRVTQIAQAAIVFRARRHRRDGVLPRPNIVCARALPAGAAVDDLIGSLPQHVARVVRSIAADLAGAPLLGPLLRVEERLTQDARNLFGTGVVEGTLAESAVEGVKSSVLEALSAIADGTTSTTVERLFAAEAGDAVRLVEAMSRRYTAVLMNPPFGDPVNSTKPYLKAAYGDWIPATSDLFALFVGRGLELTEPGGSVGAITSRVGLFLTSFERWRAQVLLAHGLGALVDLGEKVMEQATVEAAAYVIQTNPRPADRRPTFIRALTMPDRATGLADVIQGLRRGAPDARRVFHPDLVALRALEGQPVAYWIEPGEVQALLQHARFEPEHGVVRVGLQTGDDFRFVRTWWEVDSARTTRAPADAAGADARTQLNAGARWAPIVKAGASQPWYSPNLLVVDWERDGERLRSFTDAAGKLRSRPQNTDQYFKPGFSWTLRAPRLVPYVVPAGCIPSVSRYQAFPTGDPYEAVALAASNVASAYLRFFGEKFLWPKFLVDSVKNLPMAEVDAQVRKRMASFVEAQVDLRRQAFHGVEPCREFISPQEHPPDLAWEPFSLLGEELERAIAEAYGLSAAGHGRLTRDLGEALTALGKRPADEIADEDEAIATSTSWLDRLLSYLVGVAFGRWDVRIGADPSLAPKAAGAFEPPRHVPSGMLLDGMSQPARRAPDGYPLEIREVGCLVEQPGHGWDLESRVRAASQALYGGDAELYDALSLEMKRPSLPRYLSGSFFKGHLNTYSQGRRKAPIYWQLQVPSKNWGVWLYYPKFSRETLFAVVAEAEQRLRLAEQQVARLQRDAESGGAGRKASEIASALEGEGKLAVELTAFRAEAERIANLGWEPDLDDGAVLNAAPLADLFPAWRDAAAYRKELRGGQHSWAAVARFAGQL